jgi:hypothetical protein
LKHFSASWRLLRSEFNWALLPVGKGGFNRADVGTQRSEAHKPEKAEEEFEYDLSIDVIEAWQLARGDESIRDYNDGQERLF